MNKALIALVALLLTACGPKGYPEQDDLERSVSISTTAAWVAAGYPVPREQCGVLGFQFRFPETEEAFLRECPPSLACLSWETVTPCALCESLRYPTAVVRPGTDKKWLTSIGPHEVAHALIDCTGLDLSPSDPYDYHHTDLEVWGEDQGRGTADSIVKRAKDMVEEMIGDLSEET